ncbi:hypothetical protein R3P38DRAFT_3173005 [Favolaschia claudopus]|uniref:Uncharacterized protein n=1 Tax=Favolaschia claudopus TaxID=2862362 RepID=A0AAW0DME4_9AGAR
MPSQSAEVRRLACARYREKNKAKLAEKSRTRAAKYRELQLSTAEGASSYRAKARAAQKIYHERCGDQLAAHKRGMRLEKSIKGWEEKAVKARQERRRRIIEWDLAKAVEGLNTGS